MNISAIITLSNIFFELSNSNDNVLYKTAIIKKIPNGYWGIFSQKGKLLGKYKTKFDALKRLKQIEFFKHKKASKEITYSSMMRILNKNFPKEILKEFRKIYKETFDKELINGSKNPEKLALEESIKFVNGLETNIAKVASAIEMGDPVYAGKYIAEIIKFLMRRISPARREKSIIGLRNKIHKLNEFDLAIKKMPASASLGQAISLTKNLLMMHSPNYIREVLNSIVGNL